MIKQIKELSMNAFPSLLTIYVNGWIVRFSKGYAKRANSVNLIYPCSIDIEKNIKICDEMYRRKEQNTVFKITEDESALRIDEILSQQGFSCRDKTNIMLKNISNFKLDEEEKKTL